MPTTERVRAIPPDQIVNELRTTGRPLTIDQLAQRLRTTEAACRPGIRKAMAEQLIAVVWTGDGKRYTSIRVWDVQAGGRLKTTKLRVRAVTAQEARRFAAAQLTAENAVRSDRPIVFGTVTEVLQ